VNTWTPIWISWALFAALSTVSCRTVSPKKNSDVLSGTDVRGGQNENSDNIEQMDSPDTALTDPSAMWSPANRRANAMFHYLVAQKKFLQGDAPSAESHFEISYNLDPNSFTGSLLVRSKILSNPKSDEGLTEARRMALLYPFDASLRLLYGQALIVARDFKESEIQLRKAIDLNPHLEDAFVALIKSLQISGQSSSAIDVAKKMTRNNPHSVQGWSVLSRLLIGAKRVKEALEPARRAWEMQENNPELALIYALTLDLNKRGKEAVKLYEQLYRFDPGNTELVQRMLGLYKELGNLSTALSLIEDMIDNSREEVPGLKMQKVLILWELQRFEEAMRVILSLESELPESDRVAFMAGLALTRAGRRDEAVQRFGRIQEESPLKVDAMTQQAMLLKLSGKTKESIDLMQSVSQRKDATPASFLLWAEILADSEKIKDAVEVIDLGMKRFPNENRLLFSKGAYLERAGDKASAEAIMRQVIERDPSDASALNFLGYMLAEEGRNLDEAESLVTKALKLQPQNGGYLDSLGWILFQKKQYKKSLEILEKALKLEREEGVIWEHVGDAHAALGDKKKALENYKEALKIKNDSRDQVRIQKKFDALKLEISSGG